MGISAQRWQDSEGSMPRLYWLAVVHLLVALVVIGGVDGGEVQQLGPEPRDCFSHALVEPLPGVSHGEEEAQRYNTGLEELAHMVDKQFGELGELERDEEPEPAAEETAATPAAAEETATPPAAAEETATPPAPAEETATPPAPAEETAATE